MFATAYSIASKFTFPVIASLRFYDKSVNSLMGSFVIVNEEGWIVTVAHLLQFLPAAQQHGIEMKQRELQIQQIEADTKLDMKHKKKKIAKVPYNPKWITNHAFFWGREGVSISKFVIMPDADLAIGKLEPFKKEEIEVYPTIKNPDSMPIGTSLCKLGFPFYGIKADFDEATGSFIMAPGTLPVPRFPIEGIFTRNINLGKSKDNSYDIAMIETSTPGLKGQSGGPIFDTRGTIWGIQSRTQHFPLGFSPKVMKNGKEIEENQFLNVGWGMHPKLIIKFLTDHGIKFNISDY